MEELLSIHTSGTPWCPFLSWSPALGAIKARYVLRCHHPSCPPACRPIPCHALTQRGRYVLDASPISGLHQHFSLPSWVRSFLLQALRLVPSWNSCEILHAAVPYPEQAYAFTVPRKRNRSIPLRSRRPLNGSKVSLGKKFLHDSRQFFLRSIPLKGRRHDSAERGGIGEVNRSQYVDSRGHP